MLRVSLDGPCWKEFGLPGVFTVEGGLFWYVLGACASAAVVSSRRLFNWLVVERAVHGAWE
jgi:hypothetical protein